MGRHPRQLSPGTGSAGRDGGTIGRRAVLGSGTALLGLGGGARASVGAAPLALRRGINLNPWFSLTRELPAPSTAYGWPPFQTDRTVPTTGDLRRLREAGFDFARLPIDPGPFLSFTGPMREALLGQVDAAVDGILDAGLSVVLNVQPNEATHYWNAAHMVSSLAAPRYPEYRALSVELARMLGGRDRRRVALEPNNEPGGACDSGAWGPVQLDLFKAIRGVAPELTLIASGPCGSLIQGLPDLDTAAVEASAPVVFTFHFYEPYLFTHQGATWMGDTMYRWLSGVPWPASAGTLQNALARTRANMDADGSVDADVKSRAWERITAALDQYFAANPDRWFIDKYLDAALAWAKGRGIPASRLLIGEMGAIRTGTGGSASPDRARYIGDVRRSAEARGIAWAMWDAYGVFGLIDDQTRRFDPAIVNALGLTLPA